MFGYSLEVHNIFRLQIKSLRNNWKTFLQYNINFLLCESNSYSYMDQKALVKLQELQRRLLYHLKCLNGSFIIVCLRYISIWMSYKQEEVLAWRWWVQILKDQSTDTCRTKVSFVILSVDQLSSPFISHPFLGCNISSSLMFNNHSW